MSSDSPSDTQRQIDALKADLVRFVMYEAHSAGRQEKDAVVAREIADVIAKSVDQAIASKLTVPLDDVAKLTTDLEHFNSRWLQAQFDIETALEKIREGVPENDDGTQFRLQKQNRAIPAQQPGETLEKFKERVSETRNSGKREPKGTQKRPMWTNYVIGAGVVAVLIIALYLMGWLTPAKRAETVQPLTSANIVSVVQATSDAKYALQGFKDYVLEHKINEATAADLSKLLDEPKRRQFREKANQVISALGALRERINEVGTYHFDSVKVEATPLGDVLSQRQSAFMPIASLAVQPTVPANQAAEGEALFANVDRARNAAEILLETLPQIEEQLGKTKT